MVVNAEKLDANLNSRGLRPALKDGNVTLVSGSSILGVMYISAQELIKQLVMRGLTIDESTLEIKEGKLTLAETDPAPAEAPAPEALPTADAPSSEWDGINFKALRKRAKDAGLTFPDSSPKREEVIAALEKAGIHR